MCIGPLPFLNPSLAPLVHCHPPSFFMPPPCLMSRSSSLTSHLQSSCTSRGLQLYITGGIETSLGDASLCSVFFFLNPLPLFFFLPSRGSTSLALNYFFFLYGFRVLLAGTSAGHLEPLVSSLFAGLFVAPELLRFLRFLIASGLGEVSFFYMFRSLTFANFTYCETFDAVVASLL